MKTPSKAAVRFFEYLESTGKLPKSEELDLELDEETDFDLKETNDPQSPEETKAEFAQALRRATF